MRFLKINSCLICDANNCMRLEVLMTLRFVIMICVVVQGWLPAFRRNTSPLSYFLFLIFYVEREFLHAQQNSKFAIPVSPDTQE